MANGLFSSTEFDFSGIQGGVYCPLQNYGKHEEIMMKGKEPQIFSMEELGQVYSLCGSDYKFSQWQNFQDTIASTTKDMHFYKDQHQILQQQQQQQQQEHQQQQQQQSISSNYLTLDEYFGSCFPAPAQPGQNIVKFSREMSHPFALSSSLDILNNFGSGFKKLNLKQFGSSPNNATSGNTKKLSAEEVMRVAGARYIQFSDQRSDDFFMLMHPFGYALSGLSEEETRDVELAHLLLTAAEKVGYQQFDRASKLLSRCKWIACEKANPVQRVVYCFAEALRERLDKATGRFSPKEAEGRDIDNCHGLSTNLASISCYRKVPLSQIWQLAATQAITENVGSAKKLHLIDLAIRSGVQWTALMQALSDREQRPLKHLKITAVGLKGKQHQVEETGKRLESFARSMNFRFSFKVVYVSCLSDIKEEMLETASDESVVVVCNMILRTLISRPDCLENVIKVIKNLNPSIMLVAEVEANHNSPTFVNRFIEALFFYSAYFDCLETCLEQNVEHRATTEAIFCRGIREILVMEGTERVARSVKIDVWRSFFSRFRMVEIGFSESSLYQANLVPKQFPYGNLCTVDKNGNCLLVGWKGTPLHSLSAWKFSRDRLGRAFPNNGF